MHPRRQVGVREIRQNLSRYLRLVAEGETLEVTDHGTPVAVLGPIPKGTRTFDRLVADGRIKLATASLSDLPPPLPSDGGPTLTDILLDMRRQEERDREGL